MTARRRVLCTGFGPFLTHQANPSEGLARAVGALATPTLEVRVLAPLPVRYQEAARLVLAGARAGEADAMDLILALGLAGNRTAIGLELQAHNRCESANADEAGEARSGQEIRAGGAPVLSTPVDTSRFLAAMAAAGVEAELSRDAGGYVCNDLYYRLLDATLDRGGPPVLFVHVPPSFDESRVARALLAAVGSILSANPAPAPG